jgi:hypothetical protein
MLAVLGDKAPRRIYPGMLAVASTVTTAIITDEILSRRGDHVTESCLAAIEIDRAGQEREARARVTPLRAAGRGGELAS